MGGCLLTDTVYMLDTNICSYIMREQPTEVLSRLQDVVESHNRIVVSAISYAELRYGTVGKKASPKHAVLVDEFVRRVHSVEPWGAAAVDAAVAIKQQLSARGVVIGNNDIAIAGHAIALNATLVTNNTRAFCRIAGLIYEDWVPA